MKLSGYLQLDRPLKCILLSVVRERYKQLIRVWFLPLVLMRKKMQEKEKARAILIQLHRASQVQLEIQVGNHPSLFR